MDRKKSLVVLTLGLVWACSGCDVPPTPPQAPSGGSLDVLAIGPGDVVEFEATTSLETARINYLYRLTVLENYYNRIGNADNVLAARRERSSLERSQTFKWEGLPQILPPQGESVVGSDERLLVEYLLQARGEYLGTLEQLERLYENRGNTYRAKLMANVRARHDPVRIYTYYLDAEIPPQRLRPTEVIPQADALFERARKLLIDGKGLLHTFVTTNYDKERKALLLFRELVEKYPASTKIALSAYYIADIYKEYFNEDIRAVRWYERAWQWDPNITEPARFQAATVYDLRLHNPRKAIELYRTVIEFEQFNQFNARFAEQRICELEQQLAKKGE